MTERHMEQELLTGWTLEDRGFWTTGVWNGLDKFTVVSNIDGGLEWGLNDAENIQGEATTELDASIAAVIAHADMAQTCSECGCPTGLDGVKRYVEQETEYSMCNACYEEANPADPTTPQCSDCGVDLTDEEAKLFKESGDSDAICDECGNERMRAITEDDEQDALEGRSRP